MRRSSPTGPPRVRVEAAPAYELVLSLAVAAGGDASSAREDIRRAAPDLCDEVVAFAASDWMWTHLLSIAVGSPSPRDPESFTAHLETVPAVEVERRLVGYYVSWFREMTDPAVIEAAIRGDGAARRAFLRSSMSEDRAWTEALRARLDAGPLRTKRDLIELIEAWRIRVFSGTLAGRVRELRAATRIRRREVDERDHGQVLAAFLGDGYVADPATRRMLIVPSLVLGHEIHEFEHGPLQIVCVPIDARDGRVPQPDELLLLARALADESRFAIVRALADRDRGAQDLADRLGVSLPTVLHHLATLRRAGLVSAGGRRRAYTLQRASLRRMGPLLEELERGRAATRP